ncbi:hypothetical protein V2H45_08155 [Tumidithrix elongata RA019]|uniref:Novel STAND NTPase 1 domain-containing protein n=1 Tax=Tumidithrix elongata BACA0141 TaxID=2716417 RepID=A0AAW9Q0E8_9CYAN|nr:hypothetical protein [Tumidithrix elongata RA019]
MDEHIASTATIDQNSLRLLKRVATNAQGFSLSIALCNYRSLQNRCLAELTAQLPDRAIATIELEPDATTLLTLVQDLMQTVAQEPPEHQPKVLMVLGLEEVKDVSAVLQSANRVREEFANCLDFPMVLWLNDRTQDILTRDASDLANWVTAGAIEFRFMPLELVAFLRETTESLFARFLNPEKEGMFRGGAIAKGLQKFELETAVKELQASGQVLDSELAANLDFAFGFCALLDKEFASAKQSYGKSLEVWRGRNALKQAACLFQVAVCDRTVAFHRRYDKVPFYRLARESFAEAIGIFRDLGRSDLVAEYLNFLMAVVEDLARLDRSPPAPLDKGGEFIRGKELFEELEGLAREALALRQQFPNLLKEAHDRGMMAAVKIAFGEYVEAQQFAEGALALYREAERQQLPNLAWTRRYIYGLYEIWLARALAGQGKRAEAIAGLERVRSQWRHQYDAQIYVGVLEELRSQYTQAGRYLDAFHTKQHQRSVEQQYGLRAFIGAGMLHPSREEVDPATAAIALRQPDGIAVEIVASGRKQNVEELVERIRQPRYPLTVIHGDSGAGKSSILNGGVVPALRSRGTLDGRKVLVLTVNTYKEWSREIERQLREFFGGARSELNPIEHFKRNVEENYLTVLVFDQFEDFFFKKEDFADRLPFYKFLRACLHTDFVRVVLSLREDYLHYLLECDRAVNLEKVENDILGKQIRYYLGDFTPEEARRVIESLTARAEVKLEADLCDRLVEDLTGDRGRVLPIELQVVGAQLESEEPQISTLTQYLALTSDADKTVQRKPSEVLVERWLENVVKDCGEGNQELAQRVLYALTGTEEKRPQKTQEELAAELMTSLLGNEGRSHLAPLDKGGKEGSLELVLAVLVGSGLAFRVSSTPEDRYQLIHDYLTGFIRKKYGFDMAVELRMTREQLQLALAEKEKALEEKERELQRAEIAEIEALSISCEAYWLAHKELEALIVSVKAAMRILNPEIREKVPFYTEGKAFGRLWEVIYNIRECNRIEGHRSGLVSVAFSPNGKTIASGSYDNMIKLWNLDGKELHALIGHSNWVLSVAFSPDGKTIASGSSDNTVKLWNLDGKELLTLIGYGNWFFNVAFSPDGKTIVSGTDKGTIKLWSLDGKELPTLTGHSNWVRNVAFSPDSKTIVSGSDDKTIKLWNLDGEELRTLTGHSDSVNSVAFSPDGKIIVSGSRDKTIKLWNLDGEELRTLTGHSDSVNSVAFSPDGKIIVSGSRDNTIKLWDLDGKELLTLSGHCYSVNSVAFSPDGKIIVSGSDDDTIKLWNLNRKELPVLTGHSDSVNTVAFSPNGKIIASGSDDDTIKLWNLDGEELRTLTGHSYSVNSVAFSPNGKIIASGSDDDTIKLWNLDGEELRTLTGHSEPVFSVTFSPDGKIIASGSFDNTIKLWNLDGKELRTLTGHINSVLSVAFSPDGKIIASGSSDNSIKLWNLHGKELHTLTGHRYSVYTVAFSPDGKIIASGSDGGMIKLWNLDGKELCTLTGHFNLINSVTFSPDGKTIASGSSDDDMIKLWNLDGKELCTLKGHSNSVLSVAFSPDGKTIASGNWDNTIKLWDLDPESAVSQACDWLRPYLTNNPNVSESDKHLCDP